MTDSDTIRLEVATDLQSVPAADWDACAGADNPFVSHAFLNALERSGSVGEQSGWQPVHLLARAADGSLLGAVPLYLKSHSYGEYVFDHAWADALHRAGGRYYPKLQASVPFSPVPGPRLLLHPQAPTNIAHALIDGLRTLAEREKVSSVHVTFLPEDQARLMRDGGFLHRTGYQFHWQNQGYGCFDDFLDALSSRKRKAIRKERREALGHGVDFRILTGSDLQERHWDAFYEFYLSTSDRKWGHPYLNRAFFGELGQHLADKVVLVLAEKAGQPVAGALNLRGRDTLYGRNWGCLGDYPFLHFETCYYQALDYAIAEGLSRVEAGAQGEHKLQRGYLPVATHSVHLLTYPGLHRAVSEYLIKERRLIAQQIEELTAQSPYRQAGAEG